MIYLDNAATSFPKPPLVVRAMAGTLVWAAEGKIDPDAIGELLSRGDRTAAGPTVPPGGLYMTKLWYEDGEVSFHVG